MKLSKSEVTFLALLFLFTVGISILLYLDFNRRVDTGQSRIVGTLIIKRNKAERKYTRQVVWEALTNSIPLYNRDSIRTGKLSEAIIKLLDGTEITVEENSMIVLNINEKKGLNINFQYGAVQAARSGQGSDQGSVNIQKGDKIISITNSEVALSGTNDDNNLNLVVKRGEATVESGGKKEKLAENESASLSGNTIEIQKLSLLPRSPSDGTRIFSDQKRSRIPFSWSSDSGGKTTIEISPYRNFQRSVQRKTTRGKEAEFNLTDGDYYWKISAVNPKTGKKETSAISRFILQQKKPVVLFSPSAGATIHTQETDTFVNFVWGENSLATGYTLEVSSDPAFSNLIHQVDSVSTSVATKLPVGNYYWRVRTRSPVQEAVTESGNRSFLVSRRTEIPIPRPIQPSDGKTVSAPLIREQGLTLQWIADNEAPSVQVQVSRESGFSSPWTFNSRSGFITNKGNWANGTYYWRVRGVGKDGRFSDYSRALSFVVSETGQIRPMNPSPGEVISGSDAEARGVRFVWEKLPVSGNYDVIISKNGDMSSPLVTQRSGENSIKVNSPGEGSYYWQVLLKDGDDSVLSRSPVSAFQIQESLENPVIIFPPKGTAVNMSQRDTLPFQWKRVDRATDYQFVLYQIKGGRHQKIAEKTLTGLSYTISDLSLLDVGQFAWSITARGSSSSGRKIVGKETLNHFSILLSEEKAPEILSPEKQFIEKELIKLEDMIQGQEK